MKSNVHTFVKNLLICMAISLCAATLAEAQQNTPQEWKSVEDALGRKGSAQPGDVFKLSMPRSDLKVTVAGTPIKAGLALGSWLAFKKVGNDAMVMGDLVLTESEVEPVMAKLQQEGVEQTAVHNHLLNETPRVMYMHVAGHGDPVKLATALKDALALTKTPSASPAAPAKQSSLSFDTAQVDRALGYQGKNNNGIYQFSIPRAEQINDMGAEVPPSMGTATGINFQPTAGGKAAITGDFVLIGSEVNPVIRALRDNGIQVTAVHSHMLTEEPRLFFMHFWANDDAVKLATGLRVAIEKTNSTKPKQ
jgi:biotin operon repressor